MKKLIAAVLLALVVGCSTSASKMVLISPGMTRADVIANLGTPVSTGFQDGFEFLYFKLAENVSDYSHSFWGGQPYFVKLKDGKVVAYGRQGSS